MLFTALAATQREAIYTDYPSLHLLHPFTDRSTIPTQLALGKPLATFAQGLNCPCHKHPARTAFRCFRCLHQQLFDLLSEFHLLASKIFFLGSVYHIWNDLLFEYPLEPV